jgi:hypothetical protein
MAKIFVGDLFTSKFGLSLKVTDKNIEKLREKLAQMTDSLEVGSYININTIADERREETAAKFSKPVDQTASHVLVFSPPAQQAVTPPPPAVKQAPRARRFD